MGEVSIIGLYLAKNVFRANDAGAEASMAFRRKLSRAQLLKFLAERPRMVVMEAWFSAPHWSRTIGALGQRCGWFRRPEPARSIEASGCELTRLP